MKDGANLLAPACIRLGREPLLVQLDTLGMKEDADRRSAFVGTVTPKLQQCVFHRCTFVFSCFVLVVPSPPEKVVNNRCAKPLLKPQPRTNKQSYKNTAGQHQQTHTHNRFIDLSLKGRRFWKMVGQAQHKETKHKAYLKSN